MILDPNFELEMRAVKLLIKWVKQTFNSGMTAQ